MGFSVKVLADSLAPCGKRLTTLECTYPRFIHSEVLTHRMLSRNSASSRAIPTEKLIQRVVDDPVIPLYIGANQKGMQAGEELPEELRNVAELCWLSARNEAVTQARHMVAANVHKQVINRLIEPWMWITVVISATEWENFFALRCHKDAEPHFQHLAGMMREAMVASMALPLGAGRWHLPLVTHEDFKEATETVLTGDAVLKYDWSASVPHGWFAREGEFGDPIWERLIKISVGRVARVSYLTHDGRRDHAEDIALHDRLMVQTPLHASPAEHVAQALATPDRVGNFYGWRQYRKNLTNENVEG